MDEMQLELTLLGTGTCVPNPERNASGYVVRYQDVTILLDIGNGTMRRLLEAKIDYKKVDAICISHFHPDHVTDLVPFLFATRYTPGFTRSKDLRILGPVGLGEYLNKVSNVYGNWVTNPEFPFELVELDTAKIEFGSLKFETAPVKHTEASIAYRIAASNGKSITYSGDTDECESIINLAFETDLLVIECSFPSAEKVNGHLTPLEVARIATACKCKHVVLTHLYPVHKTNPADELKGLFGGKVTLGSDLMTFQI